MGKSPGTISSNKTIDLKTSEEDAPSKMRAASPKDKLEFKFFFKHPVVWWEISLSNPSVPQSFCNGVLGLDHLVKNHESLSIINESQFKKNKES